MEENGRDSAPRIYEENIQFAAIEYVMVGFSKPQQIASAYRRGSGAESIVVDIDSIYEYRKLGWYLS